MRIKRVDAFLCDAGWRPWIFVKVETDDGLVGWGECSDSRNPYGIVGCVRDFEDVLIGEDPRAIERLYWDMLRASRQNLGGTSHKAIAGIELALWDIKGKALGVPVYELFGGPMRDRMRLYWSHCGTTRARHAKLLGLPELRSYDDVVALGREVVERGFTALKTNIVVPGDPATTYFAGFGRGQGSTDGVVTVQLLDQVERLIEAFTAGVGPKVQIALDLNYNFRPEGVVKIGRLLERFNMQWIEYDTWDAPALLQIKESIPHSLASCESLVSTRQYRPFLELHAADTVIIDVPWNGFGQAYAIGQMADAYELTIRPTGTYCRELRLGHGQLKPRSVRPRLETGPVKNQLQPKALSALVGHLATTVPASWKATRTRPRLLGAGVSAKRAELGWSPIQPGLVDGFNHGS